jgi:hypothetical protein
MFHNLLFTRVQFPFPVAIGLYFGVYAFFIWDLWYIRERPKKLGFYKRWTTQDFLVVGILAVLLLVWDDLISSQIVDPFTQSIPVVGQLLNFLQFADLPYMFILMVGVAMVRKPGIMTSMIFIKRILGEIMFSHSGVNPLNWLDIIDEGVLGDMYIVWRRGEILTNPKMFFWDGLVLGFFRAVPNTPIGGAVMDPVLSGVTHTILSFWWSIVGNGLGNGLEAALTAPLAVRVARSVHMLVGQDPMVPPPGLGSTGQDAEWDAIGEPG